LCAVTCELAVYSRRGGQQQQQASEEQHSETRETHHHVARCHCTDLTSRHVCSGISKGKLKFRFIYDHVQHQAE
jgi:hypothetical protein